MSADGTATPNRRPSVLSRRGVSNVSVSESSVPPLKSPLSLRRLSSAEIPSADSAEYSKFVDAIFSDGEALLNELPSWPAGKVFDGVQTASRKSRRGERQMWHMRHSEHDRPIEAFKPLLENHAENEAKYIDACQNVKIVKTIKPGEAVICYNAYKQPFPISNRDFVHLLLSREAADKQSFVICQIPVDSPEAKGKRGHVRAAYASVERVRKMEHGKCEWTMVTTSEACGNIPAALVDKVLPMQIAQDVPAFLNWIDGVNPKQQAKNGKKR